MIYEGSRYYFTPVVPLPAADGIPRATILPRAERVQTATVTGYTVQPGDRIDSIAARVLGDSDAWWRIADLNPEVLWWEALPAGQTIRVPVNVVTT